MWFSVVLSQTPLAPRDRSFSEDSAISAKEDEEGTSDGADKPPHPDASQKEKLRDGKNTKVENLFSMFSPFHPCFKQQSSPKPWSLRTYLMPGWQLSQQVRETSPLALTIPFSPQSSGFGWFSWFRSKPASGVSTSGDEDSVDSSDSEVTSTDGPVTLPVDPRGNLVTTQPWHHALPWAEGKGGSVLGEHWK